MSDNNDSDININILIPRRDGITKVAVPVEMIKSEMDKLLRKIQTIIGSNSYPKDLFQIEELQLDIALTPEGQFALLSTYIDNIEVNHTIKIKLKPLGGSLDLSILELANQKATVNKQEEQQHTKITTHSTQYDWYTIPATHITPSLVIFLLDVSTSMAQHFYGDYTKIEAITNILQKIAIAMVRRSTKGTFVAPRYKIAMFAYSSQVIDLLDGIKTISELANFGVPRLTTLDTSAPAVAFSMIEDLLQRELPNLQDCPAPLIYHITDGEYNGADPTPIAQRIMSMSTIDGNVLIANVVMTSSPFVNSDIDFAQWRGVQSENDLLDSTNEHLLHLFRISSKLPERYRSILNEFGYSILSDSFMIFPGNMDDLLALCFCMSSSTPVTQSQE